LKSFEAKKGNKKKLDTLYGSFKHEGKKMFGGKFYHEGNEESFGEDVVTYTP